MKQQSDNAFLKAAALLLLLGLNPLTIRAQAPATNPHTLSTVNWEIAKQEKHLTVRVNPQADWSRYLNIAVGEVTYTGSSKKLTPQDASKLTSLLRDSLTQNLSSAQPVPRNGAAEKLTLDAEITSVRRSHPLVNVVTIAAVFVPLDLGAANVTAWVVDRQTGQAIAEIDTIGCGQIYQVIGSLQALGQSKIVLKKESRSIVRELSNLYSRRPAPNTTVASLASSR